MAVDDDELKRWRDLSEICGISRHGMVEGVEFDLRNELLDPREWQMKTIAIKSPPYAREASFGPFLWFPWYGELSKYKLLKEAKQYYELLQQILPEHTDLLSNSILEFVKRRIPDVTVRTGDKIIVNQVHRHFLGDEFDHAHDSEVRFAFLKIIRSNGRSIQISKPICFNGSTSILTWGVTNRDYFGRICNRICQHFGIKSLSAIDWVETDDGGHPRAAALIAYDLVGSIRELKKLADSEDHSDPLISTAAMGWSAANKAVYMGYLWAKAEADLNLKPLAKSAQKVKAGASAGGSKSGESRRQKRANTWEPIAKKMAIGIYAKNPSLSQDDIATDIQHEWIHEEPRAPGHATLKKLISNMYKAGELPKKRPR